MRLSLLAFIIFSSLQAFAQQSELSIGLPSKITFDESKVLEEIIQDEANQGKYKDIFVIVGEDEAKNKTPEEIVQDLIKSSNINRVIGDFVINENDFSIYDSPAQYDTSCYSVDSHDRKKNSIVMSSNFCSSKLDVDNQEINSITTALGIVYKTNNGTIISFSIFDQDRSQDIIDFDPFSGEKGLMINFRRSLGK